MSAITGNGGAAAAVTPDQAPRRPGFWQLLRITLVAQIFGTISIWVLPMPLALAGLFPFNHSTNYVPWYHDGTWATLALAAWCMIAPLPVSWFIWCSGRWQKLQLHLPSFGWVSVGVAIGGYGALLLDRHASGRAQVLLAVVLTPLVMIPVAYTRDGEPRPWPLSRRTSVAIVVAAALIALTYAAAHPFASYGGGGGPTWTLGSTRYTEVDVSVSPSLLPTQIEAVSLAGPGFGPTPRVARLQVVPGSNSNTSFGFGSATPASSTQLPLRLGWHQGAAVALLIAPPRGCRSGVMFTFDRLQIRYRIAGIATSEAIPLSSPVHLRCTARNRL